MVDPQSSHDRRNQEVVAKRFDALTTRELHDILQLRSDVFVVEQACVYADVDGRDIEPATSHHWIAIDGDIAVYLRVLGEPDGACRIGRVVTTPAARGAGLAARLVADVSAKIDGELVLDAQSQLIDWYVQLGFEVSGDEFVEDGIAHVPMRRR